MSPLSNQGVQIQHHMTVASFMGIDYVQEANFSLQAVLGYVLPPPDQ
jgi:hypothetical protein